MSVFLRWRQRYFSRPVMHYMRRQLNLTHPELLISPEPQASGWDAEIFSGTPNWQRLQGITFTQLTPAERAFLAGSFNELCQTLSEYTETPFAALPDSLQAAVRHEGCFGLTIPTEYQGLGFSYVAYSQAILKLSSCHLDTALTLLKANSGISELLRRYGSTEQKAQYLPRLAQGLETASLLMATHHGTQLYNPIACATLIKPHTQLLLKLTLEAKVLAYLADPLIGLVLQVYDPEQLLSEDTDKGLCIALVPRALLKPDNQQVITLPLTTLLGSETLMGHGDVMLLDTLSGRGIGVPALETGIAKVATRYTGAYARIRQQLGMPLGYYQGIEELLARMMGNTYLMDAARTLTASAFDQGERPPIVTALVKYQVTERLRQVLQNARDIIGNESNALPSHYLKQVYESLPSYLNLEGNNLLLRSLLVFGQATLQCHPQLLAEIQTALRKDLEAFDTLLMAHAGQFSSNLGRSMWYGLTNAVFKVPGSPTTRRYYRRLTRLSSHFGLLVDYVVLSVGGNLQQHERLSGRMADIIANLYLCLAALKHYSEQGEPEADKPLMEYACTLSIHRAQQAILAAFHSLPRPWLSKTMRALMFPYGKPFSPPNEHMIHAVAQLALEQSLTRERLTQGIQSSESPYSELGRLDTALELALSTAGDFQNLKRLAKIGKLQTHSMLEWIVEAKQCDLITAEKEQHLLRAYHIMLQALESKS